MDLATLDIEAAAPCRDPECDGTAEPEQDGEQQFMSCTTCGFEFGYKKVETTELALDSSGACAIGVPESVRRAFSGPAEPAKPQPVSLGLSIPVRSSE